MYRPPKDISTLVWKYPQQAQASVLENDHTPASNKTNPINPITM